MLLDGMLKSFIQEGSLKIIDAKGKVYSYGNVFCPKQNDLKNTQESRLTDLTSRGPIDELIIRLHNKQIEKALLWQPELALGEGYMNGDISLEKGTLRDLLELCTRNLNLIRAIPGLSEKVFSLFSNISRLWLQYSPLKKARKNVEHHYDLNGNLYQLFLDKDQQYSCAYFKNKEDSLETAQINKKQHIAKKLLIQDGQRILDIGSGWGGMALYLASLADVEVVGLTLSKEQYQVATERARQAGLSNRVKFYLKDYREETGKFDRIVSVGMFEHVGVPQYKIFFEQVYKLLNESGIMLLHSIGSSGPPRNTNAFIRKYIFPGGYCPSLSEVFPDIENAKLHVTDIEILRYHYAETLKAWYERFIQHRDKACSLYDEKFCRMWEYYLLSCEMGFRYQELMVFQLQIVRNKEIIPLTRDYLYLGG